MTARWTGNEPTSTKPARIWPAVLGALVCVAVCLVLMVASTVGTSR
jgi:hypothetical protein